MKKIFTLTLMLSVILAGTMLISSEEIKTPIDPGRILNIQGNVKAVMTSVQTPKAGAQGVPLAFVKIKIFDKNTKMEHFVQLAPGNYLRLKGLFLKKNDNVKIKGFTAPDSPEVKSMTIEKGGIIIPLRDEFGRGMWTKTDLQSPGREARRER